MTGLGERSRIEVREGVGAGTMMIISDEEVDKRIEYHRKGRKVGSENIPAADRLLIAAAAELGGEVKDIAEEFGTSESEVRKLENGRDGEVKRAAEDIHRALRNRIIGKAQRRLLKTLEGLDPVAIATEKPRVQAAIAKDLAIVSNTIEKGNTRDDGEEDKRVVVHFYVPDMRGDKHYPVIEVEAVKLLTE